MLLQRLVLIRHAHRETLDRSADNGLSPKGKDQAKRLSEFFRKRFMEQRSWSPSDWVLLSSPKRRCIETLKPWESQFNIGVQIKPELDEKLEEEDAEAFVERVRDALNFLAAMSASKNVIICSHGDWIPTAANILTGSDLELKKGAWLELEPALNKWKVRWLVQKL